MHGSTKLKFKTSTAFRFSHQNPVSYSVSSQVCYLRTPRNFPPFMHRHFITFPFVQDSNTHIAIVVEVWHVTGGFKYYYYYYYYSIGTTAHCGLWPVEQCPSIFSYLPPTLSIFSLLALKDLFLLPLSIFSWVFPFFSSLPVLEWRSFWASYPPPFPLGDLISLSFAILSISLYFLFCSSLLVLDSSDFSIPRFHN